MGLRVAGVDMLEGDEGPLVMEVNSSPGLQGIETATKLDVAGAIIDYIAGQVAFPEIDVRQRLTVSTGYGVAELMVHGAADLVGKTLGRRACGSATSRCSPCTAGQCHPEPAQACGPRARRPPVLLRQAR